MCAEVPRWLRATAAVPCVHGARRSHRALRRPAHRASRARSRALTSEVVAGPTAEVIDAAASNHDADAIYVGPRGAGRAKALLGSVAHDVLHRAERPVTVITERAAERLSAEA